MPALLGIGIALAVIGAALWGFANTIRARRGGQVICVIGLALIAVYVILDLTDADANAAVVGSGSLGVWVADKIAAVKRGRAGDR